jgi:hypothetical protein
LNVPKCWLFSYAYCHRSHSQPNRPNSFASLFVTREPHVDHFFEFTSFVTREPHRERLREKLDNGATGAEACTGLSSQYADLDVSYNSHNRCLPAAVASPFEKRCLAQLPFNPIHTACGVVNFATHAWPGTNQCLNERETLRIARMQFFHAAIKHSDVTRLPLGLQATSPSLRALSPPRGRAFHHGTPFEERDRGDGKAHRIRPDFNAGPRRGGIHGALCPGSGSAPPEWAYRLPPGSALPDGGGARSRTI